MAPKDGLSKSARRRRRKREMNKMDAGQDESAGLGGPAPHDTDTDLGENKEQSRVAMPFASARAPVAGAAKGAESITSEGDLTDRTSRCGSSLPKLETAQELADRMAAQLIAEEEAEAAAPKVTSKNVRRRRKKRDVMKHAPDGEDNDKSEQEPKEEVCMPTEGQMCLPYPEEGADSAQRSGLTGYLTMAATAVRAWWSSTDGGQTDSVADVSRGESAAALKIQSVARGWMGRQHRRYLLANHVGSANHTCASACEGNVGKESPATRRTDLMGVQASPGADDGSATENRQIDRANTAADRGRFILNFKLGDVLGKGTDGTVWKSLNMETGDVVAIKQVPLLKIPSKDLPAMMQEIDLMKNFDHPNIVRYLATVKTKNYLNIVLEYVENGSLSNTVVRFGSLPEALVAVYIEQVMQGLCYLHAHGVVHRDVKGANILTTKQGTVKLADFGVATRLSDLKPDDVAGSPYWMAPEVIEMSPITPAADIWSVGATVVELLTGSPPYFHLPAVAALFRIVEDECPPLPSDTSSALGDFLRQCFRKQAATRRSAQELLGHDWIATAISRRQHTPPGQDWDSVIRRASELHETSRKLQRSARKGQVAARTRDVAAAAADDDDSQAHLLHSSPHFCNNHSARRPDVSPLVRPLWRADSWESDTLECVESGAGMFPDAARNAPVNSCSKSLMPREAEASVETELQRVSAEILAVVLQAWRLERARRRKGRRLASRVASRKQRDILLCWEMFLADSKHEREEQARMAKEEERVRREQEEMERQRQIEQKEALALMEKAKEREEERERERLAGLEAERRREKLQREMIAKRERERRRKMEAIQEFISVVLGADAQVQQRFRDEMIDAQVVCECSAEDLAQLGITRLGQQKRLLAFARDQVMRGAEEEPDPQLFVPIRMTEGMALAQGDAAETPPIVVARAPFSQEEYEDRRKDSASHARDCGSDPTHATTGRCISPPQPPADRDTRACTAAAAATGPAPGTSAASAGPAAGAGAGGAPKPTTVLAGELCSLLRRGTGGWCAPLRSDLGAGDARKPCCPVLSALSDDVTSRV